MATNKHAQIRYIELDKCFSNYGRKYSFDDLIEACNDAIYREKGDCSGVSVRTIRDDIRYMKSEEGYSAPIEVMKDCGSRYYRYTDKDFAMNKRPLNSTEVEQLKNTLIMLGRFKGISQLDWISEVVTRLEGSFNLNANIAGAVGFDQNIYLKGLQHFNDLFEPIVSKQVLQVEYHPAFKGVESYILHPYYLKQYNNRWFLFGLCNGKIMNMALDRIESFKKVADIYIENIDIDFNEYFDDVVGVTVPSNREVETILLKVDKDRYNYIDSKPLHPTQSVIKQDDNHVVIRLKLIRNYEFDTLLLGFADSIEIMEPAKLREDINIRVDRVKIKNI